MPRTTLVPPVSNARFERRGLVSSEVGGRERVGEELGGELGLRVRAALDARAACTSSRSSASDREVGLEQPVVHEVVVPCR